MQAKQMDNKLKTYEVELTSRVIVTVQAYDEEEAEASAPGEAWKYEPIDWDIWNTRELT